MGTSFLRAQRLEGYLGAALWPAARDGPAAVAKASCRSAAAEDEDDGGWADGVVSAVRVLACFVAMLTTTLAWTPIMLVLLPWPHARVRQGNLFGHVTGRILLWVLGSPLSVEGLEHAKTRGIYVCNHASPLDIVLAMWIAPTGTVGIAKKEIIWYPLFGQLYVLANHLRIDRSNPAAAIDSVNKAADAIVKNNLSLILFPEGTRSKTGRLLQFKKGFAHVALRSKLPIIPVVLTGTHLAWRKNSLRLRPVPLAVRYLPPIKTDEWEAGRINEYVDMVHAVFADHLPESQKPI